MLEESVGIPEYYQWRSRSGCYFCFFQRRDEWIGLAENHPELFEQAKQYEKLDADTGKQFTWVKGTTLDELLTHKDEIKAAAMGQRDPNISWQERIKLEDEDDPACLICTL